LLHEQNIHGVAALRRAATLAWRNDARLTVATIIGDFPRDVRRLSTAKAPSAAKELVVTKRQAQLEQFIAPIRHGGIRLEPKVLVGTPVLEVIREVLLGQHDLVMMAAEGSRGPIDWLAGSTSTHLMRKCPCPVWVHRQQPVERCERILAAVDPDPGDEERNALNPTIRDLATWLAEQHQSELHIVHVWSTESGRRCGLSDRLAKQCLDPLNHRVHFLQGDAGIVIPELARAAQVDLMVMGAVGRTRRPGSSIGSTAETILQQADCSVLTVKPQGRLRSVTLGVS